MSKIQTVFATLSARYGKFQPKDGQILSAVAQSWQSALGAYSLSDLNAACADWMATSKYPRWPEPAELLESLRSFGAKPELPKGADNTPAHIRHAQNDAAFWYKGLLGRPLPDGAWPWTWADALESVIKADKPGNGRDCFGFLLTQAWLRGDIPTGFDQKAAAFFAECQRRKAVYLSAVKTHGHVRVNERTVNINYGLSAPTF